MNFIKPIIVIYLNFDHMDQNDAERYVREVNETITSEIRADYHVLIVGRQELPNEIVLLNPNFFITEEQQQILNNILKEYEQRQLLGKEL